jgi:hypothetical protein
LRGAIRGGAGVVRGGRPGFVAVTGAGGFGETDFGGGGFSVLVLGGLGESGLGGVPVLTGERDLGDTVDFGFDVPVVCGERRAGDKDGGRDNPAVLSKGFPGDWLRVRILANFSANSFVTPS